MSIAENDDNWAWNEDEARIEMPVVSVDPSTLPQEQQSLYRRKK